MVQTTSKTPARTEGDGRCETGLTTPALADGLGFRISRVARHLRRDWAAALKPLELTPPQAAVVRGVAQEPGCSLRGLARRLGADPMNVKRCVDELEHRGLIRSASVTSDRRPRTLTLTAAGQAVVRRVARLVDSQQTALTGSMSPSEMKNLMVALERLELHLGVEAGDDTEASRTISPTRRGLSTSAN